MKNLTTKDLSLPEKDFFNIGGMTDDEFNNLNNPYKEGIIDYQITTPMIPKDLSCLR